MSSEDEKKPSADALEEAEIIDFDPLIETVEESGPAEVQPEEPVTLTEDEPAAAETDEKTEDVSEEEIKENRKRRRRRPAILDEQTHSAEIAMRKKELASRGELKRIQKAGVRVHGRKVITDDVNKLKSLAVTPAIPPSDIENYYVEPVRIEYYIPKESRFVTEVRYLYIPLVDPTPRPDVDEILEEHMDKNRFVDIVDLINNRPQYTTAILESYHETFEMYERLNQAIREAKRNKEAYRTAFYMVEALARHEPTTAALEILGEFQTWNINWLIRKMNEEKTEFSAEDTTISYLIKRRNIYYEQMGLPYDERFEILASLFYDQAFPNRGMEIGEEDFFFDIFDQKSIL